MKLQGPKFSLAMALVAVLAGGVGKVSAAPLFLNNTITARIPVKDLPSFRSSIAQVLNQAADGTTTQWLSTGPDYKAVQATITPLQTVQTQKANTCRLLDVNVRQLNNTEKWAFWFCKQGDGIWKASGSYLPR